MKSYLFIPLLGGLVALLFVGSVSAQTLEQRIERLERISSNPVLLQQAQKINEQQREIQNIYDQVDRLTRKISQLEAKLNHQFEETDQRLSQVEAQSKALPASTVAVTTDLPAPVKGQDETEPVNEVNMNHKQRYDEAFGLLRDSKYDESIVALKEFIKDFPATDLTSNAYYWLGEAYLIKQDYAQAFEAFNQVITGFSSSNKMDDSLLRGADSLVGLNRLTEAKKMYQDLIKRSPDSRLAKSAERRLERFKTESK